MAEETFKITFISNETKESFYLNVRTYSSLYQLKIKLFPKCGVQDLDSHKNFKIYWIDEDGDEISVIDDEDLRILADRHKGSTPIKLYVRSLEKKANADQATAKTSAESTNSVKYEELPIHPGVICDGCDDTIRGFRYKCIQCLDYDLCCRCEQKMLHNNHLMVRIPFGLDKCPRKIDRVLHLGRGFEVPDETIRKCRKDEQKCGREQEKHKRYEEKLKRHEEKLKKKAHRRCAREQHRASAPTSEEPQTDGANRPGTGLLYHVTDFLNYLMNPDNILENLNQDQSQGVNGDRNSCHERSRGCPVMNSGYHMSQCPCPRMRPDKAQEAKEKSGEPLLETTEASKEERSGFENFYENLKPTVANAVPLGTDANVMTTSIGVAAKEVETENNQVPHETPQKDVDTEKEPEVIAKPIEEILREKLQAKLAEMEREIEKERKNRSSSPTISYTSEDSEEMKDRDWTVLDNDEEPEAAKSDEAPTVQNLGAIPKENRQVEDKATLTENSSNTSSVFGSANGNGVETNNGPQKDTETPKPDAPKATKPLTFAEMGEQLKSHIDQMQKLAVPIGPPAGTTPVQPPFTAGIYPHPHIPTPNQSRIYHPKPHINHAIHTMEGMGFSNDGGWLTSLLDTVDGNIPRALDLLQPHQK